MKEFFQKCISPFSIAWGRTPVAWKWKAPSDDLDAVRIAIARRYHPRWRRSEHIFVSDLLYFFMLVAWPLRGVLITLQATRKHGARAKKSAGRGMLAQIWDQLRIAFKYHNNPEVYYLYDLYMSGDLAQSRYFLMTNEIFSLVAQLNNYEPDDVVEDKLEFNAFMRSHGLDVIHDIAVIRNGRAESLSSSQDFSLPTFDFIAKPLRAVQGQGFSCYRYIDADTYALMDGGTIGAEALLARLLRQSNSTHLLIQPRVSNHQRIKLRMGQLRGALRSLS